MVTHCWSNLFLHLVAAVVADALEQNEFNRVAERLVDRDFSSLQEDLRAKDALCRKYWICAFCVNQHSGICGDFGPMPLIDTEPYAKWDKGRRDTVTGEVFEVCTCSHPKAFNDQPECEMNKFSDMMLLLQRKVEGFRQIVAVDNRFEIFSRSWCIAELAQAHYSEIPQKVLLASNQVLNIYEEDVTVFIRLATLTVTECQASRPQDREEILKSIPNVADFDARVQMLVCGENGLLSTRFSGFGILDVAAHTARRVAAVIKDSRMEP